MREAEARDREDMTADLNASLAAGDLDRIMGTLGQMARAHGMRRLAQETGLGRESLYKSMRVGARPEFTTVLKVARALGLVIRVMPNTTPGQAEPR